MQVSALLKFPVLFVPLLFAATVKAEIYTWKDAKGVSHYTNSMYDVPDRYRARVKALNLGIEEKGVNKMQGLAPEGTTATPAPQAPLLGAEPAQSQRVTTPSAQSGRHRRARPSSAATGTDE